MRLSVVIPVYNVAPTLDRCVRSVLAQGVDGMEVILVDDGSTDGSSQLADGYAARAGVRVVHQRNAGLSEARNAGLALATGDYVTFVDSDDYLAPGTYAPLLALLRDHPQCDLLEYAVRRETGKGTQAITFPEREYRDMRAYWIEGRAYAHCYACNKLCRRSLFGSVRFPRGKRFEDVYTLLELLRVARCVRTTAIGWYQYTYNPLGITAQAGGDAWRELLLALAPTMRDGGLQAYQGYGAYYRYLLNVQLHTYALTGDGGDILLPRQPCRGGWKLRLLRLLGMRGLCRLYRMAHTFYR